MTTKWHVKYLPVKKPVEDPRGWSFPYQGDDWPEEDDWYWVWQGKGDKAPSPVFSAPQLLWWDDQKCRFLAASGDIYAWRPAIVDNRAR